MGTPHPVAGVEDAANWQLVIKGWLSLGLTAGVSLELFSLIGSWFIAAVEPLSQKVLQTLLLNVFKDVNSTSVLTGHSSLVVLKSGLVPTYLHQSCWLKQCFFQTSEMVSCHLQVLSLWVLLQLSWFVTRGKLLRMIIFGTLLLPLFLLSGTLIAPFATELAKGVGAFQKV